MTVSARDLRIIEECKASDEPCIVLRAKDTLAAAALSFYLGEARSVKAGDDFLAAVADRVGDFVQWAASNPDAMKIPDLRPEESTS